MAANRRNVSDIWKHMTKVSATLVKCNICSHSFKYSGGTSNLRRHLDKNHMLGAPVVLKNDDPETADLFTPGTSKPTEKRMCQGTLPVALAKVKKYEPDSTKKRKLDGLVLDLVTQDLQPFSVVEDRAFKNLVSGLDPRYDLPCRKTISSKLLPAKYIEEKTVLKNTWKDIDQVAVTTDSWTSRQTISYTTVTAHFFEPIPSWELKSAVLQTSPVTDEYDDHTAASLASMLMDVFKDVGIDDKISAVATDNASVMVACVNSHLKMKHVRCFAHLLNLIAKQSIKSSKEIETPLKKVKAIVKYFHHSTTGADKLRSIQSNIGKAQRKLIQDVETRWNSTLHMLRRYIEEHCAVEGALTGLRKLAMNLTDEELTVIQGAIDVLAPFEVATENMSAERHTSYAKMIPTVKLMTKHLEMEPQSELRDNLLQEMWKRFSDIEKDLTAGAATFLDPRFKSLHFSPTATTAIKSFS